MSKTHASSKQIPLPFAKFERFDFNSFQTENNREALACLKKIAKGEVSQNIYLWGQSGSGKSHLLQGTCTLASDSGRFAAYIPLNQLIELSPDMLSGLEQLDLVCIDDLDCIEGNEVWEQALFHLHNKMRQKQKPLLITANKSPKGIAIKLLDLKSRLSWDLIYHLTQLDENSLITALKFRARSRMFDLPDDVIKFLVKRVSRDTHTLFDILDKLDDASLQSKKKLTIPFVKNLLGLEV